MNRVVLLFCLLLSLPVTGQVTEFSGYNWSTFPEPQENDTVKPVNGAVITLERRITEVYVNKEDKFEEISIFHRKIRVMTREAVNDFNKIFIPLDYVIDILGIRARFISPDGRITELPDGSIRQVENLENKGDYRTFAIEGAEAGGEIEYYYTLRKKYDPYGSVIMQGDQPRTHVDVLFAYPSKLEYLIRCYNGFPGFLVTSDTITGMTHAEAKADYIPSLANEKYAAYRANLMRFEYTLAYNNYQSVLRVYSFSKLGQNVYNVLYQYNRPELTAMKSLLKKLNLASCSEEDKIRKIENWVKSEMAVSTGLKPECTIDEMIRLKQTSKYGVTRLLIGLLNQAGIQFELAITCDREEKVFDPDFNGWNFLDDYLIYFPGSGRFLVPDDPGYRFGVNPSAYQGAYALFLHPVSLGDNLHTLAYEVKRIPDGSYMQNTDSLQISLSVSPGNDHLEAHVRRVFTGELAASYQSFWLNLDENRRKNVLNALFNMGTENITIESYSLEHAGQKDIGKYPLTWHVDLVARSLLEQAGHDLLVRIGETIGEQSELYQQKNRKLPVWVNEVHNYYRQIVFTIPDGYTVSNPDDLNSKVEMMNNGRLSCSFRSWYTLSGKMLYIYSREFYSENEYPAARFDDFRKVINAAADFNKKTLVLTRQE